MVKGPINCPFCTRKIRPSKGGFVPEHVTPGNIRCIAIGLAWRVAVNLSEQQKRGGNDQA